MSILFLLFVIAVTIVGGAAVYSWMAEDATSVWGKVGYGVLVIGAGAFALPIYMLLGCILVTMLAVSYVK